MKLIREVKTERIFKERMGNPSSQVTLDIFSHVYMDYQFSTAHVQSSTTEFIFNDPGDYSDYIETKL